VRRALVILALLAGLAPGGATARPAATRPTVFAAASLTDAFPKIGPRAKYSFAGSNALAAQIRQGAPADVFASANMALPNGLYRDRLCSKPVVFTRNELVVIVPRSNPARIHRVVDLTRPGVKVVIGDAAVPVGAYTLTVLKNLGIADAVLKNVVSRESDVKGVVGKVALGEADAGFVYVTDVRPVRKKVLAIAIRAAAQPRVVYEVCVLEHAPHPVAARRFVSTLIRPAAQRLLVRYGFGRRPKRSPGGR
jgi:molybdate transport system substrate-binding protein